MSQGLSGVYGNFNIVPPMKSIISIKTFTTIAGINPIEVTAQQLPNVRGYVHMDVIDNTTNFVWSIDFQGGFGPTLDCYTQNFYVNTASIMNCTVVQVAINQFTITTPATDSGGRTYTLQFYPYASVPYTLFKTAGAVIADSLIVRTSKQQVVA